MSIMPCLRPVWMMPGSMNVLASRIVAPTAGVVHEHLQREHPALAVRARDELLADDAAQALADHHADLLALIDREHVEHAVERAGRAARVQRAEHEVPRLAGA